MTPLSSDAKIPGGEVGHYKGCRRAASKRERVVPPSERADSLSHQLITDGGARTRPAVALVEALHELGRVVAGLKLWVVHDLYVQRHGRLDPFDDHRFERAAHARD